MLLKIQHIGTKDRARLYAIQSASGLTGMVALSPARVAYGKPERIAIALVGTQYTREYPVTGALSPNDPPRIRDLDQGYDALAAFILTWEHSTPDQRADLCEYDGAKWSFRKPEDHPRAVPATPVDGTWYRVDVAELKRALKGTRAAVRIGAATIKPSILRELVKLWGKETGLIDLRHEENAIGWRSVEYGSHDGMDTIIHSAHATIYHGAGDPYAGRNGFEARLVLQAA